MQRALVLAGEPLFNRVRPDVFGRLHHVEANSSGCRGRARGSGDGNGVSAWGCGGGCDGSATASGTSAAAGEHAAGKDYKQSHHAEQVTPAAAPGGNPKEQDAGQGRAAFGVPGQSLMRGRGQGHVGIGRGVDGERGGSGAGCGDADGSRVKAEGGRILRAGGAGGDGCLQSYVADETVGGCHGNG